MAKIALLWQVLALAMAAAHAQFDLPYPLQLVRGPPSAVSPQLYGPEPKAVSLLRATTTTQPGEPHQQAPAEEEMTQFHSQDAAGRSLFGYMMADQARIEARGPDGSVRGSYSYLDPSGRAIKVQYWDEGQGFHAAGNHLPATYPGLPQPVRDTPEVEAARQQHLQAYQQVLRRQLQLLYQQQLQEQQQQQQQQQQQVYQPPSGGGGDSEEVVVESDPAAPPSDYPEDEPGQRYPSLPLVAALYDPSHVHDVGRDAVIVDTAAAKQTQQGSTLGDLQKSRECTKTLEDPEGNLLGQGATSGRRFVIVYADRETGNNGISETDDEKPSAKHVRSAQQNSTTSDVAAQHNHTASATRRARRGRITIYDYIKERDPERMARDFPESYLIQEIFNSTRVNTPDDTDAIQRAAEREFQFLRKIGGAKSRGRSMLAADVVASDSGDRHRTFYKAGVVLPDLSYSSRHSGVPETSRPGSDAASRGGERYYHRGFAANGNRGTPKPQFTYVENRRSDTTRKGQTSLNHNPSVSTEGEISHNFSVSSVNSTSQDTPHPVYYPDRTHSYLDQTQLAEHAVFDETGRSNMHREQSPLPGFRPITPTYGDILGTYDTHDVQEPYNYQESPLDPYYRPQEQSRSHYVPHPVYYKNDTYDLNETRVTPESSLNGTDNVESGGQYPLDDSFVASSQFGTLVASHGRNDERVQDRNFFTEGRMPVTISDVVYNPPHSKYGALFYRVNSDDDSGIDRHRSVSRVSTQTVAPPHVSGTFYSMGSTAHQPTHHGGHPFGVTNVGGYPPVAMQYLQDIARRGDTPVYGQAGSKEATVINNLIGRSASSKARSLEAPAADGGKVADPEGRTGASKEELVAEAVAAGSSRDEHETLAGAGDGDASSVTPGAQRSVVSVKDGRAESYSAMYLYPERQGKAASPKAAAMPQPQVDGGFFYSFHHPVIPVAVQLSQPVAADAADAAADAKVPPRGLSVSQRASLYDAVPVAAVHDAQVPPYLRGAVADHQTKPIFIHYDPAEAAAAS